jgi:hypothetical protein
MQRKISGKTERELGLINIYFTSKIEDSFNIFPFLSTP